VHSIESSVSQIEIGEVHTLVTGEEKGRSEMDRKQWKTIDTYDQDDYSRVLVTLLFTDLVGSTELAVALGDQRWRDLLARHHATVRENLDRYCGREIDCAGDGFFATFETATHAVRCGLSLTRSLHLLGLEVRVGLHTGECERFGDKVSGVAVHAAARLSQLARPGEILVSGTVRDVVAGSGLRFEERDAQSLKGLPGSWNLFAAVATVEGSEQVAERDEEPRVHRLSPRERHQAPVSTGIS
jgi:class 3 adenylate cyclase